MREFIAGMVVSDPQTFNEGILEKRIDEYIEWILKPSSWGGSIELFILAKHFNCELAAIDIKNTR